MIKIVKQREIERGEDSYNIEIITTKELTQQEYFELTEALNQITNFFDTHMDKLEKEKEKEE